MRTRDFKLHLYLLTFVIIPFFLVPIAYPASETIYASYKYTMGDNDTKNDAKRICFIEAKRLAIEKAGTFIESSTEVKNFQLTRDEIRTFAGAIVKVDIASEEIKFVGESTVIFITVKADVDVDSFRERVKQIKGDRELEGKIREQQTQLQTMENKTEPPSALSRWVQRTGRMNSTIPSVTEKIRSNASKINCLSPSKGTSQKHASPKGEGFQPSPKGTLKIYKSNLAQKISMKLSEPEGKEKKFLKGLTN